MMAFFRARFSNPFSTRRCVSAKLLRPALTYLIHPLSGIQPIRSAMYAQTETHNEHQARAWFDKAAGDRCEIREPG